MKELLHTIALLCTLTFGASAQVANYTFSQTTSGTYGSALTGTLVGLFAQDDDVNPVALPFNFNFNGTNYNSIEVCSNGYMSFSSLTGTEYLPISDMGTSQVISPFGNDLLSGVLCTGDIASGSNSVTNLSFLNNLNVGDTLIDIYGDFNNPTPVITQISGSTIVLNTTAVNTIPGSDIFLAIGRIRSQVTGTAPNRVMTFEYRNYSRYFVYDESINFKVRLYETSNKIEVVYGTIYPGIDYSVIEVGLKGNSSSDYNSRFVGINNTWATSTAATNVFDGEDFDSGIFPPNGLTYIWSPACAMSGFSITQSSSAICPGQSATLTANGATSYTWVGVGTTTQIVVSPTSNTTYTLIGSSGSCLASLTITQTVVPAPTISIAQSKTVSCAGESVTLTASGAISYSWVGVGSTQSIAVAPTSNTTYTVIGLAGTCESTMTVLQTVDPSPTLNIAMSQTAVCAGASLTLTASGATTYTWVNNGSNAQITVTPTANSIYTVVGTLGNCTSQKTVSPGVTAYPNLSVTLTRSVICAGETTSITAAGAGSYAWSNGSVTAVIRINPTSTTVYTVTGANGTCAKTSTISQEVNACLGITGLYQESNLTIYPNPFLNEFQIRTTTSVDATISVQNLLGMTIYETTAEKNEISVSTSGWPGGVYLVTLTDGEKIITKKVVKQ